MKEFRNSNLYKNGGIAKIKISNFRSVSSDENAQIVNLAPLTIICGENSSGKSTLLNVILFLKQIFDDTTESGRGSTNIDLNGPLVQLGEYSNLKNLNTDTEEIRVDIDIVRKPMTNDINQLLNISLKMEPDNSELITEVNDGFVNVNKHNGKELHTKKIDFRLFTNTSGASWFKLLNQLTTDTDLNDKDTNSEEKQTKYDISYEIENFSFENSTFSIPKVDSDLFTRNIQFYNNTEDEIDEERGQGIRNDWRCGYTFKKFYKQFPITQLKSDYEYALPPMSILKDLTKTENKHRMTDLTKTQKLNVSDKSIEKYSEIEVENIYDGTFFQGGIPERVNHSYEYFDYIATAFVKVFSGIANKGSLSQLYSELSLEEYGDDFRSSEDGWVQNPDESPEVDGDGYIDVGFDVDSDSNPVIEEEDLFEFLLNAFADLFEIRIIDNTYTWEFFNKWENLLDLPYLQNFEMHKSLDSLLQAKAETMNYEKSSLSIEALNKNLENAEKDYETSIMELFNDLIILVTSTDIDGENFSFSNSPSVRGDCDRLILSELSAIINNYEISKEVFVNVIDRVFYNQLSERIASSLNSSLKDINDKISDFSDKFKYQDDYIFQKKDLRPTINSLKFSTDQPLFSSKAPLPEDIELKLESFRKHTLDSVKYLGPLRDLKNYEKKSVNFEKATPVGLSAERFFNYFHEFKNTQSVFIYPNAEMEYSTLKEAFCSWLLYFEIAESFDTYYEVKDNNLYGMIKPMMLKEEVRMDSLGVGFSQLAPIILLCLNASEGDTILLEQPELHLHPSVQQKFGDFILAMSSRVQIIVETHSDHLLNRVRRRVSESEDSLEEQVAIYFAERLKGNTSFRLAELDSNGSYRLTDFPKGFFDQGAGDAFALLKNTMLSSLDKDEL